MEFLRPADWGEALAAKARRALGWTWESYRRGTSLGAEGVA
ncbi:hypothetical protein ACE1OC_14850 [Streptomyces sp. DSM 116496]